MDNKTWNFFQKQKSDHKVTSKTCRPVDFGISVNPISTRVGGRLCPPNDTGIPGFSDLPAALTCTYHVLCSNRFLNNKSTMYPLMMSIEYNIQNRNTIYGLLIDIVNL